MNTNNQDPQRSQADALEALAAGFSPRKPAASAAEPELIEEDSQESDSQDFLNQMARESKEVNSELSMLRSMVGGSSAAGFDPSTDSAFADEPASPSTLKSASMRAAKLQSNTRKRQKSAFKETMIPLLLVVGGLLILLSIITVVILSGDGGDDTLASEGSYMREYGKFFIMASLPIGAICIMGAWMFYLDIKKASGRR